MKKDIAILTYWGVPNYGAWTQAYALCAVINQKFKKPAKQIAYLEQSHWERYYKNDPRALNCFFYGWEEIPHTRVYTEKELPDEKFDIVIIGADSIWSFERFTIRPDLHLLGAGIQAKHLYAYAPSCDMLSAQDITAEMVNAWKRFDRITVRDTYSKKLMVQQVGIESDHIDVVLDPALLWDFTKDQNVKAPVFSGYIAVYGAGWSKDVIEQARTFATVQGLQMISLGFINTWCDISICRNELRPFEWLGFFSGASYVITSTFHGLMVGLNFQKQIFFDQIANVKNRSDTLIDALQIRKALMSFDMELDYRCIEQKMQSWQRQSMDCLKEMLG